MQLIKDILNYHMIRLFENAFISRARRQLRSIAHEIRCLIKPHNVVKAGNLSRYWIDRDRLMFHAMFQILIDFVELEKPFSDQGAVKKNARHTNIAAMREWIEKHYNSKEAKKSLLGAQRPSKKQREKILAELNSKYLISLEIIHLYTWYKKRQYRFDLKAELKKTGYTLIVYNKSLKHIENGESPRITSQEVYELEQEHQIICDRMLQRLLNVRKHLWI